MFLAVPYRGHDEFRSPQASPSRPPNDPRVNDHWIDDAGDAWTWDGTEWMPLRGISPDLDTAELALRRLIAQAEGPATPKRWLRCGRRGRGGS